jgi:hypothetical protein
MVEFAEFIAPTEEELSVVLKAMDSKSRVASEVLEDIEESRRPYVLRSLGWLAKLGLVDFS